MARRVAGSALAPGAGGRPWLIWGCMGLLCLYSGNAWALLALPLLRLGNVDLPIPRVGRAFYGYYIGHLALLALVAALPLSGVLLAA